MYKQVSFILVYGIMHVVFIFNRYFLNKRTLKNIAINSENWNLLFPAGIDFAIARIQ